MADFAPMFIKESELASFGLPTVSKQKNILNLVQAASVLIDEHCGRVETTGKGSLVYSTYTERLYLPENRPIIRISYKPLVAIPESTRSALDLSGNVDPNNNWQYTGFQSNSIYFRGVLSPILSCSGCYGFSRRGSTLPFPQTAFPGPFELFEASLAFGNAPIWANIAVQNLEFEERTGELHIPIGLYPITEIQVTYNSGFDPRSMPNAIKHACAMCIKNFLGK